VGIAHAPASPAPKRLSIREGVRKRGEIPRAERRLAGRLARRDPAALEALYREYGGTTFGYLVRALGDRGLAEDVQQQVFLEAWQRADQYDLRRAGLLTWLMTITRSRAIDQLRRRVPEPHDPSSPVVVLERDTEAEAVLDQRLEQWRVAGLLERLPEQEAVLLRMRFYDGLSQSEIAQSTGVALGTVKSRMVSALEALREMLEDGAQFEDGAR
jgi:RNA polymerase sigma-70 factor (ECF subfamily)